MCNLALLIELTMRTTHRAKLPLVSAILLIVAITHAHCLHATAARRTTAGKIVERARLEATRRVQYDAGYQSIPYPGGDVPADRGACTDVIVRALRAAGKDLQVLIHQDKVANPDRYPRYSGRRGADANIDHRRVPNHLAFLKKHGKKLPIGLAGSDLATWQPGDLVYVKLPSGLDHCGVISDKRNAEGIPLMIHNLSVAAEEDVLGKWRIVAHYRFPFQK